MISEPEEYESRLHKACISRFKVKQAIERVKLEGSWKAFLSLEKELGLEK